MKFPKNPLPKSLLNWILIFLVVIGISNLFYQEPRPTAT